MTKHSVYSFSSSHRWMEGFCPASVRMSKGYENNTNPAAELGTAVHELGEFAISLGVDPRDCIGLTFNHHVVNEKMAEDAGLYKTYVNDLSNRYGVKPLLEQRVVMSSLGRDDVYGTSDCTHISILQRTLHTTDYKNGYGLVDVEDNSQTAGYSVATLDTFDLWNKVDKIYNTIVQPNGGHIAGPIRTVEYSIADMRKWQAKYARSIAQAEDPLMKPVAGEHCTFCLAQDNCRARIERSLKFAYTDVPATELSTGEMELIYRESSSIKRWLDAIEKRALQEARAGKIFEDHKLVKYYSQAKVVDKQLLLSTAKSNGVELDKLFQQRFVGKTAAMKLLPKDVVEKCYETPEPTTALVPLKDKRPAIRVGQTPSAAGIFKPL